MCGEQVKTRHFVSAKTVCALLERHLGVSLGRTNVATFRYVPLPSYHRAGVHAIAIAAPRAAADAQHFGGQAIMVNAGTLKALERKGAAKKPTRLVVPQNSALLQKNDGRRTALLGSIFKLEAHLGLVWCVQKVYFWMACSVFTKVSSQNHHTTPYLRDCDCVV